MSQLTKEVVEEVNNLIAEENLGFPEFRKKVATNGSNVAWVRKALASSGKGSARLRELLGV